MSLIRIQRNPSRRQLAVFAVAWAVSLMLVGWLWPLPLGDFSLRDLLWVLAVIVPVLGLVLPGFLRSVYLGSAYLALPLGIVVSHIVLAGIYYLVLTPIGLALRLTGYDPLHRSFEPSRPSYWTPREEHADTARYFRQF